MRTMTVDIKDLDPHEQPSEELRAKWKAVSRTEVKDLASLDIDDLQDPESAAEFRTAGTIPADTLNQAFRHICPDSPEYTVSSDATIYYHPLLPGTYIRPSRLGSSILLTSTRPQACSSSPLSSLPPSNEPSSTASSTATSATPSTKLTSTSTTTFPTHKPHHPPTRPTTTPPSSPTLPPRPSSSPQKTPPSTNPSPSSKSSSANSTGSR
jgi:hypothetical protein